MRTAAPDSSRPDKLMDTNSPAVSKKHHVLVPHTEHYNMDYIYQVQNIFKNRFCINNKQRALK